MNPCNPPSLPTPDDMIAARLELKKAKSNHQRSETMLQEAHARLNILENALTQAEEQTAYESLSLVEKLERALDTIQSIKRYRVEDNRYDIHSISKWYSKLYDIHKVLLNIQIQLKNDENL